MSTAQCKHGEFCLLFFSLFLFFEVILSFQDGHIGEVMLDVATSDDANDWPWGNDLLRQGERKKGARRETVLCKYQAMAI